MKYECLALIKEELDGLKELLDLTNYISVEFIILYPNISLISYKLLYILTTVAFDFFLL